MIDFPDTVSIRVPASLDVEGRVFGRVRRVRCKVDDEVRIQTQGTGVDATTATRILSAVEIPRAARIWFHVDGSVPDTSDPSTGKTVVSKSRRRSVDGAETLHRVYV